jgi:hypothetical protein
VQSRATTGRIERDALLFGALCANIYQRLSLAVAVCPVHQFRFCRSSHTPRQTPSSHQREPYYPIWNAVFPLVSLSARLRAVCFSAPTFHSSCCFCPLVTLTGLLFALRRLGNHQSHRLNHHTPSDSKPLIELKIFASMQCLLRAISQRAPRNGAILSKMRRLCEPGQVGEASQPRPDQSNQTLCP